ncbi:MAG: NAD(P)-dependent alcohol dehydrogenase [Chloroflexota bacterium]|nr:NAD(P)-dependent alcohol dehydrogenase [Chloroflexota bacterium]
MKAAMRDRYGPPEVVDIRDVERPIPTADQVLVRVVAASVNRADIDGLYPRWGFTKLFLGLKAPKNPRLGLDLAGVVEAVGPDVNRFSPGDEVFGDLSAFRDGSFAEFVCAPERAFAAKPSGLSFEDAASLPHSAVLALQGLRTRAGRTPGSGDTVLIVGASGNVGPFAVQVAKAMGAEVSGVCRTDKVDFVRSLGADHVIDYTTTDYTKTGQRYDWILDVDSRHSIFRVRRALTDDGVYLTLGGSGARLFQGIVIGPLRSLVGKRWTGLVLWWKPFHAPDVERILGLIAAGKVTPVIDRRYPLSDIVAALRWVDDGHAQGKVIVTP